MSVPFTTAEMAAATRRYGYPRGSEFDDGVRVGPTFPGFVSNEVAANLSMAGVPDIQTNCPPLNDCQTVMGYGALLAPIYSYSIKVNGAGAAPAPSIVVNNAYPTAFTSVSTWGNAFLDNAITSSDKVTVYGKEAVAWVFDWPRTVDINVGAVPADQVRTACVISVYGVDMYNQPMVEDIAITEAAANAAAAVFAGEKAFKAVIGWQGPSPAVAVAAGLTVTISPSLTTFGLPFYTSTVISPVAADAVLLPPSAPYTMADPADAANWDRTGTDLIYTPVPATASAAGGVHTGADVRGTITFLNALNTPTSITVLAYCPGFDGFIKQQIINKSPYGRYQVPAAINAVRPWVTVPTPAWLISPQTQYGAKQYWGNPAI